MNKDLIQINLNNLAIEYNLQNIYLVDNLVGDIFYTLKNNIALGTNLFEDIYSKTELSTVFQKALVNESGKAVISDFIFFLPESNKPVAFYAFPIFQEGKKVAVFIAELKSDFFEKIIYGNDITLVNTAISYNLIGKDNLIRMNDINQLLDSEEFFKKLSRKSYRNATNKKAVAIQSSSMVFGYNKNLDLSSGINIKTTGYLNKNVLISSIPVNLKGLDWTLLSSIDRSNSNNIVKSGLLKLIISLIIVILISLLSTRLIRRSIIRRLLQLIDAMKKVSKGEYSENIESNWKDEIGETIEVFENLKDRLNHASSFALALSDSNFQTEFKAISEHDNFANSLNTLKKRLLQNKIEADQREKEDFIRNWTNDGIAKFNDLLRQSNNNINNLAYLIIENLIEYLDANQGGVFLVEGSEEFKTINLIASYAYNKRKYITKTIEIGEGLIGNCYLEKKPIHLRDLPEDYIEITSGLGSASPRSLFISPMILDNEILGFIEIASFNLFSDYQIDFINKLTENIAATFATVNLNTRTAHLLEESKKRANEIAQQEEEMRQNLEEMQATQEELSRLKSQEEERTLLLQKEIDNANKFIQAILNGLDGEIYIKDANGIIIHANEEAAKRFNLTVDKLKGKTLDGLLTLSEIRKENDIDNLLISEKLYSGEIIELINNVEIKYFVIKKQFYIPTSKELGILTIRMRKTT